MSRRWRGQDESIVLYLFSMAGLGREQQRGGATQHARVSERDETDSRGVAECAEFFFFSASSATPRESFYIG